jgi:hypothetical protein
MHLFANSKLGKICLQLSALLFLGVWLFSLHGCITPQVMIPLPQSSWGEMYAFSYHLPPDAVIAKPGSVPVTVAVVNPSYKEEDSALGTPLFAKVGKGLSNSMGTDLDKILIAKGVTTTGPFPSLSEITYSEKKDAALTLAPKVFITTEMKKVNETRQIYNSSPPRTEQDFVMSITGWMVFIMQEPLSGEKMWIKKLELEPVTMEGTIANESVPHYANDGCGGNMVVGYSAGNVLYDGRADAMASAMKKMYPVVLAQFQKYIDTDEMVQLKEKGKEIRALKVY